MQQVSIVALRYKGVSTLVGLILVNAFVSIKEPKDIQLLANAFQNTKGEIARIVRKFINKSIRYRGQDALIKSRL